LLVCAVGVAATAKGSPVARDKSVNHVIVESTTSFQEVMRNRCE